MLLHLLKSLTYDYYLSLHDLYKSRIPTEGEQISEMYFLPSQASISCEPSSHSQLTKKLQDKKAKKVQALDYEAYNLATHLIIINNFHNKESTNLPTIIDLDQIAQPVNTYYQYLGGKIQEGLTYCTIPNFAAL